MDSLLADAGFELSERFMLLDTATYLPGDILAKVDRAAMAVLLETRIPYLDHHLFSLAWSQPDWRSHSGQAFIKQVLRKHSVEIRPHETIREGLKPGSVFLLKSG